MCERTETRARGTGAGTVTGDWSVIRKTVPTLTWIEESMSMSMSMCMRQEHPRTVATCRMRRTSSGERWRARCRRWSTTSWSPADRRCTARAWVLMTWATGEPRAAACVRKEPPTDTTPACVRRHASTCDKGRGRGLVAWASATRMRMTIGITTHACKTTTRSRARRCRACRA